MIPLKILGSALIVLSSSLFGLYYGNRAHYRIADLEEFKKTLILLKSEIEFSMTALPEAMALIAGKTTRKFAAFFEEIGSRLNQKTGESIGDLWEEALALLPQKTYLAEEDTDYFRSLGGALGALDRKLQSNSIQVMIAYIDATAEALAAVSSKSKKMYPSLGILGGILIAVVLL